MPRRARRSMTLARGDPAAQKPPDLERPTATAARSDARGRRPTAGRSPSGTPACMTDVRMPTTAGSSKIEQHSRPAPCTTVIPGLQTHKARSEGRLLRRPVTACLNRLVCRAPASARAGTKFGAKPSGAPQAVPSLPPTWPFNEAHTARERPRNP